MVYARKRNYRRRIYRRKTSNKQIEKVVKKVYQREQKKIIEPKVASFSYTTAITDSVQIVNASVGVSGDGNSELNSVKNLSIQLQGTISNNDTVDRNCRVMLIRDKMPDSDGTLPDITHILETDHIHSFPNVAFRNRFDIIRDWKFTIAGTTDGLSTKQIKLYKKLGNYTTWNYKGGSEYITKNQYLMVFKSDDTADGLTNNIKGRLVYIDA